MSKYWIVFAIIIGLLTTACYDQRAECTPAVTVADPCNIDYCTDLYRECEILCGKSDTTFKRPQSWWLDSNDQLQCHCF